MSEETQERLEDGYTVPARAVVIAAHADDIEFGCAGTVARWTQAGTHVTYVLVTNSAAGSNDPGVLRDDLIRTRQQEQARAAAKAGVHDVRTLGHEDGHLVATLDLRRDLTRIIREIRPQVVVTMDPEVIVTSGRDYINHPDHRATGESATYATFPSAGSRPIFRELLAEGYEPHEVDMLYFMLTNAPTHCVDISATIDTKRAALTEHKSQLDEKTVEMVIGWNRDGAKGYDFDYAEHFRVIDFRSNEDDKDRYPAESG